MLRKAIYLGIAGLATVAFSVTAIAGSNGNGNGAPTGKHYNLNIIGVEQAKSAAFTGSNRHVIFVPLRENSKGIKSVKNDYDGTDTKAPDVTIETQIWLMPGEDFRVCDGNGFDAAYACDDNPFLTEYWEVCAYFDVDDDPNVEEWVYECRDEIARQGAVFELPCNNGISGAGGDVDTVITCGEVPQSTYEVWARANPSGGEATMTTCASIYNDDPDVSDYELQCSTENYVASRTKGRDGRYFADVTDQLTSAVVDLCVTWVDGDCTEWETTRIALFSGDTQDWFWNYANRGLRHLQLRFYE